MTKKLLVEGWRGINHSYSLVNQYQLLELEKHNLDLFHHDVLPYMPHWNPQKNFSGFDENSVRIISSIGKLPENIFPEITYRISFPYNLEPIAAGDLFVFGTSEYQNVSDGMVSISSKTLPYKQLPLKIITPSNWSRDGFLNAGFESNQVEVVPHGVNLSIYRPVDADVRTYFRGLIGANIDSFVILAIGAMTTNKGIDILLDAYLRLKYRYPEIRLVLKDQSNLYMLTGVGVVQHYCKERKIDLTSSEMKKIFSDVVVISENLDFQQLNGLYNAADCYVSPYRAEGFNLPPLEAAAAGIPIIVTKGGATDDYVDPSFALQVDSKKIHKDGKFSLEPNLDSLVEKIESLILGKNIQLSRENARTFLEKNFSWSVVTNKLLDILFKNKNNL